MKQKCNIVTLKIPEMEILLLVVYRCVCLKGVNCYTYENFGGLLQNVVSIRSRTEGQNTIKIKLKEHNIYLLIRSTLLEFNKCSAKLRIKILKKNESISVNKQAYF